MIKDCGDVRLDYILEYLFYKRLLGSNGGSIEIICTYA